MYWTRIIGTKLFSLAELAKGFVFYKDFEPCFLVVLCCYLFYSHCYAMVDRRLLMFYLSSGYVEFYFLIVYLFFIVQIIEHLV